MARYHVTVSSDSTHTRKYELAKKMTALTAAKHYGKCEGNERVEVYEAGILIDKAIWPIEGKRYRRVAV